MSVQLGDLCKDTVTGFEGVCVARTEWLNGCWRMTLQSAKLDKDGKPRNPDAQRVIDLLVGNSTSPAPAFEPIDAVVKVGLIPQCAMRVTRTSPRTSCQTPSANSRRTRRSRSWL